MKLLVLTVLFALTLATTYVLTYDQPGAYTLTPESYYHSEYLTIELWSAGAGASSGDPSYGGGSGAYIKATILAKDKHFVIGVGKGGKGAPRIVLNSTNLQKSKYYGMDGGDSFFREGYNIDLQATGGSCVGKGGIVESVIHNNILHYAINGESGKIGTNIVYPSEDNKIIRQIEYKRYDENYETGNGGDSPFGGQGGYGINNKNGIQPGGGGAASYMVFVEYIYNNGYCFQCEKSFNCAYYPEAGDGADGLVKIYYENIDYGKPSSGDTFFREGYNIYSKDYIHPRLVKGY